MTADKTSLPPPLATGIRCRIRWLGLALLLAVPGTALVGAEVAKEYQVKAAFLYNFTKFVEWPPTRTADPTRPITIGVLGRNPFGDELERILQGRKVNGRELVIAPVDSSADATAVDLLFVCSGEERRLELMRDELRSAGVLTVGESDRFIAAGGIINFTLSGDKLRFIVNLDASDGAGLKISAQLLKLAAEVLKQAP